MNYMLLIYADGQAWGMLDETTLAGILEEYVEFTRKYSDSGTIVGGHRLHGPETATTLAIRDGERVITDGPFADTKEQIGGYYVIDADDLDAALDVAADLPGVQRGVDLVEVRPVFPRVVGP